MVFSEFSMFHPVRSDFLLPLPVEKLEVFRGPGASDPIRKLGLIAVTRTPSEIDYNGNSQLCCKFDRPFAGIGIVLRDSGIRMECVSVAAEGADRKTVVLKLLFELFQLFLVFEHREFAMRVARVISRPKLDSCDV